MGETKTIPVAESTKDRLAALKPFDSMTWNDLIVDMADHYEAVKAHHDAASDRALNKERETQ